MNLNIQESKLPTFPTLDATGSHEETSAVVKSSRKFKKQNTSNSIRNRILKVFPQITNKKTSNEKKAVAELAQILDQDAFECVNTTPDDIISRGHPDVAPALGGYFAVWYNKNKTDQKLQSFLNNDLKETNIAKKLKNQIIRYEIDAPYELNRKSSRITGNYEDNLVPSCLRLTKKDLFDKNNNYLLENPNIKNINQDDIDSVYNWYFTPTPFYTKGVKISMGNLSYELTLDLQGNIYSESEVAKKLSKCIELIENQKQIIAAEHYKKINTENLYYNIIEED